MSMANSLIQMKQNGTTKQNKLIQLYSGPKKTLLWRLRKSIEFKAHETHQLRCIYMYGPEGPKQMKSFETIVNVSTIVPKISVCNPTV